MITKALKYGLITVLVMAAFSCFASSDFSYVYIQGDKKIPIYVKFEEQMIPRYGKNYSIISRLAPGPAKIQILFQQNAFPPQDFVINVPENGFRGFLLVQNEDESFSLYDLYNKYYLPAGNKAEDDVLKLADVKNSYVPVEPAAEKPVAGKAKTKITLPKIQPPVKTSPKKENPTRHGEPAGPQFIDDIELNSTRTVHPQSSIMKEEDSDSFKNAVAIINSDCPKAISNKRFDMIQRNANNRSGTEKLKYLMSELDNCFTSNQARILTRTLRTDAERFTFLKNVYSRITDQAVFPRLESTLNTEEWKGYFRELISKP